MNLISKENLYALMRDENCPFWQVFHQDGRTGIAKNVDLDDVDAAIARLERVFSYQGNQEVVVEIREDLSTGRPGLKSKIYKYRVADQKSDVIVGNVSGHSSELADLKAQVAMFPLQQEIADLKRKLDEKEDAGGASSILQVLQQVQTMAKTRPVKTVTAAPGITGPQTAAPKLSDVLKEWKKLDPNFFKVLLAIIQMAKDDPNTYATYSNMLIQTNET